MAFKYAIALTGGIATGKSTVSKLFAQDGFDIIDADKIAHKMLDRYSKEIARAFGSEILDGNGDIDRRALGHIVFSDEVKREALENFIHPLIYEEIEIISENFDREFRPYIVDIPLFFEGGNYNIENIVVVYAPAMTQLERLMRRDGLSQDEAILRIKAQLPIEHKKSLATHIIDNSLDADNLLMEYQRVRDTIIGGF